MRRLRSVIAILSFVFCLAPGRETALAQSTSLATDWLVAIADGILGRTPDPADIQWDWGQGVMMYGLWKTYECTGDVKYYNYIKGFVDHYVDEDGELFEVFGCAPVRVPRLASTRGSVFCSVAPR